MIRKSKEEKTASEAEKKEIAELERQKRILEMEKLKSEIKKNLEDTTKSKWNRWMEAVKLGGKLFGQLVLLPVGAVQVAPVVADQATKFAESHAGAAKAAIVEKSTMPKVKKSETGISQFRSEPGLPKVSDCGFHERSKNLEVRIRNF